MLANRISDAFMPLQKKRHSGNPTFKPKELSFKKSKGRHSIGYQYTPHVQSMPNFRNTLIAQFKNANTQHTQFNPIPEIEKFLKENEAMTIENFLLDGSEHSRDILSILVQYHATEALIWCRDKCDSPKQFSNFINTPRDEHSLLYTAVSANPKQLSKTAEFLIHHGANVNHELYDKDAVQAEVEVEILVGKYQLTSTPEFIDLHKYEKDPLYAKRMKSIKHSLEAAKLKTYYQKLEKLHEKLSHLAHLAVENNKIEFLSWVIEQKVSLKFIKPNKDGDTLLHVAMRNTSRREIATLLLREGADINAKNNAEHTPLYEAASDVRPDFETVKWLIEHGATIPNDSSHNPLIGAVKAERRETIELLIKTCTPEVLTSLMPAILDALIYPPKPNLTQYIRDLCPEIFDKTLTSVEDQQKQQEQRLDENPFLKFYKVFKDAITTKN